MSNKDKSVLIVGAGEFGLSLALELSRTKSHDYSTITILDREMPPVAGGSSVDINRIMRPDYADLKYTLMGLEALKEWQTSTLFRDHFYQSHIVLMAPTNSDFRDKSMANLQRLGLETVSIDSPHDLRKKYPAFDGTFDGIKGYSHVNGGWVNAEGTVRSTVSEILRLGKAQFITGADGTMVELVTDGKTVTGVRTRSGKVHTADLVVMATGSWTPSLMDCEDRFVSTAQPVGFLQLTPEETAKYKSNPVYINIQHGVFVFPPTPDGVMKCARHGYGYTRTLPSQWGNVSTPPQEPIYNYLPPDAVNDLRQGLSESYGREIAERPFFETRLCWYTDSPSGDFVFSFHPNYDNLFMCTSGCGHAFKFFPVLGKYSLGCLLKTLTPDWLEKFALKDDKVSNSAKIDGGRNGSGRQELTKL